MCTRTEIPKPGVEAFVFAGNATITLQCNGRHFTYNIAQPRGVGTPYFVRLLSGPNNEEDYTYLGCYFITNNYFHPCKTWKGHPSYTWPPSLRLIARFMTHLDDIPDDIIVYHEGRCGRCGRKLTTPESIDRGFGPECWNKIIP